MPGRAGVRTQKIRKNVVQLESRESRRAARAARMKRQGGGQGVAGQGMESQLEVFRFHSKCNEEPVKFSGQGGSIR